METISVAVNESSGVLGFEMYLINLFEKSAKADRCTDVMYNLTLYCLFVIMEDLDV